MGRIYDNKIVLGSGYKVPGAMPMDDREVVQSLEDLNSLVSENVAYQGMIVYVVDKQVHYKYISTGWEEFTGSGGSDGPVDVNEQFISTFPSVKPNVINPTEVQTGKYWSKASGDWPNCTLTEQTTNKNAKYIEAITIPDGATDIYFYSKNKMNITGYFYFYVLREGSPTDSSSRWNMGAFNLSDLYEGEHVSLIDSNLYGKKILRISTPVNIDLGDVCVSFDAISKYIPYGESSFALNWLDPIRNKPPIFRGNGANSLITAGNTVTGEDKQNYPHENNANNAWVSGKGAQATSSASSSFTHGAFMTTQAAESVNIGCSSKVYTSAKFGVNIGSGNILGTEGHASACQNSATIGRGLINQNEARLVIGVFNNPIPGNVAIEFGGGTEYTRRSPMAIYKTGQVKVFTEPTESDDVVRKSELDDLESTFKWGDPQQKGQTVLLAKTTEDPLNPIVYEPFTLLTYKNSIAIGGKRYDKLEDPDREETSAEGCQAVALGGSSHAYGDWALSIGKDNKSYQRASVSLGGSCRAGLTEEEFNTKYGDSDNDGIYKDYDGNTYDKSYSFAIAAGADCKALNRVAIALGNRVEVHSRYGVGIGNYVTLKTELYDGGGSGLVGIGQHISIDEQCLNVVAIGHNLQAKNLNNVVLLGGFNSSTFDAGDLNTDLRLIVGNGTPGVEKNIFTIDRYGRAQFGYARGASSYGRIWINPDDVADRATNRGGSLLLSGTYGSKTGFKVQPGGYIGLYHGGYNIKLPSPETELPNDADPTLALKSYVDAEIQKLKDLLQL